MSSDGPSIDGDLLDEAENILRGRDKDNAITSGELSAQLGLDDGEANPKAREIIRMLLSRDDPLPVAAGNVGYWVCETEAQAAAYRETLRGRIAGIEERLERFDAAWNAYHRRTEADGGMDVPPQVRDRIEADPVLSVDDWLAHDGGDA